VIRLIVFITLLAIVLGAAVLLNPRSGTTFGSPAQGGAPIPAPTLDEACDRASHLAKLAWSTSVPEERYEAAADGLGVIAACRDDDQRTFGEAMLMSVKTDAEYRMQIGNARWDASRAVERLDACIERFRKTSPAQAETCRTNRIRILRWFPGPPAPQS
jgi:hypothetical protein